MRNSRLFSAGVAGAIGLGLMMPTSAGADASSFPPAVDAVVNGDVTEYQWMLPAVNAAEAHTEATGAGVTVAVIDTGVDATHPDLEGQVVPGAFVQRIEDTRRFELVPATTIEQTSDDWYGHGSHVSGIIAGDDDGNGITGIAPGAQIMPVHTFPRRFYIRDIQFWKLIAQSIDFSVASGADVINMSLGGQSSGIVPTDKSAAYLEAIDLLCDAVGNARAAGTVVVASAGNSGDWGNPENVPASCDGTFTVAALAPSLERTYWSSFDATVDISAPGEDILSVDSTVADNSPTPHLMASGTSMSSPVVAGAVALVLEKHPAWTPDQVEDQLTSTAKDLGVTGRDPNYGWGIVDTAAAVGAAAPNPKKQNFFPTWYEPSWGGKNGESVVSWSPPAADTVTGYTVTVYTPTTLATYDVGGLQVRADVLLPPGAWFTVTAHTSSGDVTSYPRSRYQRGRGDSPAKLSGVKVQRDRDQVIISWDKPRDPEDIDVIRGIVHVDGSGGNGQKKIKVDQDAKFPLSVTIDIPKRARWYDLHTHLILINKDENGKTIGSTWMTPKKRSAAIYGSHVQSIASSGTRAVEVTGGLSPLNAKRACGNTTCKGESAVLVVDRGRHSDRFQVVFTSQGKFHQLVAVDRGTTQLKVRIVGPKRLDSGPFVKVSVDGKDSNGCAVAKLKATKGC
ncbi:MAG: S8 family serine peptidase [Actinomycetes bacterium]